MCAGPWEVKSEEGKDGLEGRRRAHTLEAPPFKGNRSFCDREAKGWGMYLAVDPLRSSEASEQKHSGHVVDKGRGVSREGGSEAMGPRIFVFKGSFPSGRTTCIMQREARPRTPRGVMGRDDGPRAEQYPGMQGPKQTPPQREAGVSSRRRFSPHPSSEQHRTQIPTGWWTQGCDDPCGVRTKVMEGGDTEPRKSRR